MVHNERYIMKEKIKRFSTTVFSVFSNIVKNICNEILLLNITPGKKRELRQLTQAEYEEKFVRNHLIRANAFKKAWETRNFEIDLYWKRAGYFWAFEIPIFAGYVTIVSSTAYDRIKINSPEVLFYITCIGVIISFAWLFVNKGSKQWQRHWEHHIDMLEDLETGPLYKTVFINNTFSVSKINEMVSKFFVFVWCILAIKYLVDFDCLHCNFQYKHLNKRIAIALFTTIYFCVMMVYGNGRGRFGNRPMTASDREKQYSDPTNT